MLINSHIVILGMISKAPLCVKWAQKNNIDIFDSLSEIPKAKNADYIFSIINYTVLSSKELALPRLMTINLHFSPLPKYAGINALTWAILNSEKIFGISWHVVEKKIDTGDILEQETFTVEQDITAEQLTLRCRKAALVGFSKLIKKITTNSIKQQTQNKALRSYYSRRNIIPCLGLIDYEQSSADIIKMHRSLSYGQFNNYLSTVKILVHNMLYSVLQLSEGDVIPEKNISPGTVLVIKNSQLLIACNKGSILISALKNSSNKEVAFEVLRLAKGDILPSLTSGNKLEVEEFFHSISKYENFWKEELRQFKPLNSLSSHLDSNEKVISNKVCLKKFFIKHSLNEFVAILCFIIKFFQNDNFFSILIIALREKSLACGADFFSPILPFNIELVDDLLVSDAIKKVSFKLEEIRKSKNFSFDVIQRYKELDKYDWPPASPTIIIDFYGCSDEDLLAKNLYININAQEKSLDICTKNSVFQCYIHFIVRFLAECEMLTEAQLQLPLREFNLQLKEKILDKDSYVKGETHSYKTIDNVYEYITESINKSSEKIALYHNDVALTYRQLAIKIAEVEKKFELIIRYQCNCVGLLLKNRFDMLVHILTLCKLKIPYVPLNDQMPIEIVGRLTSQLKMNSIISSRDISEKYFIFDKLISFIDEEVYAHFKPQQQISILKKDVLYIALTSGSTGIPKPVVITHGNLNNIIHWSKIYFHKNIFENVLGSTSFYFDISMFELFATLANGGSIHLVANLMELAKYKNKELVETILCTPSALQTSIMNIEGFMPKKIKNILFCGEVLSSKLVSQCYSLSSDLVLYNLYGPCENTIYTTVKKINSAKETITIGKPIFNNHILIVDEQGEKVLKGFIGEVYIAGPQVCKGYAGENSKNIDSFCLIDGYKYYKTGDLGALTSEGEIYYHGRNDDQIKVNGYRVELSAIDRELGNISFIKLAKTIVSKDGNKNISAFVELKENYANIIKGKYNNWGTVYEKIYEKFGNKKFAGWYQDNTVIPEQEMDEWLELTIEKITQFPLANVLDIGCGNGLITAKIEACCSAYVGIDLSKIAIEQQRSKFSQNDKLSFYQMDANEIDYFAEHEKFDFIIFNSIVQYFDDDNYLLSVLKKSWNLLSDTGVLFIGDIPDIRLSDKQFTAKKNELTLLPAYFQKTVKNNFLSASLNVLLKTSKYKNQLFDYRYDVFLKKDSSAYKFNLDSVNIKSIEWNGVLPVIDIKKVIEENIDIIIVKSIPIKFRQKISSAFVSAKSEQVSLIYALDLNASCFSLVFSIAVAPEVIFQIVDAIHQKQAVLMDFSLSYNNPSPISLNFIISDILRNKLPSYSRPQNIYLLDNMPLNSNGKIDNKVLIELGKSRSEKIDTDSFSDIEKKVFHIWQTVLRTYNILLDDDFFSLGGNSLHVLIIINAIKEKLNIAIDIHHLYKYPTIRILSRFIHQNDSLKVKQGKGVEALALSQASLVERQIWLACQLRNDNSYFNMGISIKLLGELNINKFAASIKSTLESHEIFRAKFTYINDLLKKEFENKVETILYKQNFNDFKKVENSYKELMSFNFKLNSPPLYKAVLFINELSNEAIFVFVIHHIIADTYTLRSIFSDIAKKYNSSCEVSSVKYAYLPSLKNQEIYYKNSLTHSRKKLFKILSQAGKSKKSVFYNKIPNSLYQQLTGCAKNNFVSGYTLLLAAFICLIYRYLKEKNVTVGTVKSQRQDAYALGCFSQMVPISISLTEDEVFSAFLSKVKKSIDKLFETTRPIGNSLDESLFDFNFVLLDDYLENFSLENVTSVGLVLDPGFSKYGLNFCIKQSSNSLENIIEYDSQLYSHEFIKAFQFSYETLLNKVVVDNHAKISSYEIVKRNIKIKDLLYDDISTEKLIATFYQVAEKYSQRVALYEEGLALTYHELLVKVNEVSKKIPNLTQKKLVAVHLNNSIDAVIIILAILVSKKTYVPIHIQYKTEQIKKIISDLEIDLLITNKNLTLSGNEKIISIDVLNNCSEKESIATLEQDNSLAYIICTSGTTGSPKYVPVKSSSIIRLLGWGIKEFSFSAKDRWLLYHSNAFDFSVWECWGALLTGAALYIPKAERLLDIDYICYFLKRHKVTILNQTPSSFSFLSDKLKKESVFEKQLCYIFFGGETLNYKELQMFFDVGSRNITRFINMYGISEGCIHVTYHEVKHQDVKNGSISLIGKAIPSYNILILDEHLNESPLGVAGKMYINGPNVINSYVKEESALSFIKITIEGEEKIFFDTGDIACRLENDSYAYIGRGDSQVSHRGYRIELGAIESVLCKLPYIINAVVMLDKARLIAYLRVNNHDCWQATDITKHLECYLPEYMWPTKFYVVNSFPRNHNYKMDMKSINKEILYQVTHKKSNITTNLGEQKPELINIFKHCLNIGSLDLEQSIFGSGGDSLSIIRIISQLNKSGLNVEPAVFYEEKNIAGILNRITNLSDDDKILNFNMTGRPRMMAVHQWWYQLNIKNKNNWFQYVELKIGAHVVVKQLKKAINFVYQKEPLLYSIFDRDQINPGLPLASNILMEDICLKKIDYNSISSFIKNHEHGINIEKGQLFKVYFITSGDNELSLVILCHHLVTDLVSWEIFLSNIEKNYYDQDLKLNPTEVTDISYTNYSLFIQAFKNNLMIQEQLKTVSFQHDIRKKFEYKTKQLSFLYKKSSNTLSEKTIRNMILSAFAIALCKINKQDKVFIDIEGHGRDLLNNKYASIDSTIGWFTHFRSVLLNYDLQQNEDEIAFLKTVANKVALCSSDISFLYNLNNRPAIAFNYSKKLDLGLSKIFTGNTVLVRGYFDQISNQGYDIILNASRDSGQISLQFNYNSHIINEQLITKLACRTEKTFYKLAKKILLYNCFNSETNVELPPCQGKFLPLTAMQRYFFSRFEQKIKLTNNLLSIGIDGQLDVKLIELAWKKVVKDFAIFQVCFIKQKSFGWIQMLSVKDNPNFNYYDFQDKSIEESCQAINCLIQKLQETSVDLNRGPLISFYYINQPNAKSTILILYNYLLLDGASLALIVKRLSTDYSSDYEGVKSISDEKDYINYLVKKLVADKAINYPGISNQTKSLKTYFIASSYDTLNAKTAWAKYNIQADVSAEISACSKRHDFSVANFFQVAWGLLLASISKSEQIAYGVLSSNRNEGLKYKETVAGLFTTILPMRFYISAEMTVLDLFKQATSYAPTLLNTDYLNIDEIDYHLEGVFQQLPFESLLIYQNFHFDQTTYKSFADKKIVSIASKEHTFHPLTIRIYPVTNSIDVAYLSNMYTSKKINDIFEHYLLLMKRLTVAINENSAIHDFLMATHGELQ